MWNKPFYDHKYLQIRVDGAHFITIYTIADIFKYSNVTYWLTTNCPVVTRSQNVFLMQLYLNSTHGHLVIYHLVDSIHNYLCS